MSLYLEHFNLRELPFRLTPAVEFFYRGCVRGETLEALKYAIANGEGIISVVGEVGTGKSMLCRVLMNELKDEVELVYIANPSFSDLEIIYHIAEELALDISGNQHQVARDLQGHLLSLHQQGKKVLVCIDEAQAMPDASLEQIRLLSNLETSTDKIVQIVLFGQPELTEKLSQQHLRQLRERITSAFMLRNLDAKEVKEYINHRLIKAGNSEVADEDSQIFTAGAIRQIAKVSQGISRRINILCDKAMLAAFADNSEVVAASHAQQAARDARYRRLHYEPADGGGTEAAAASGGGRGRALFAIGAACVAIAAVAEVFGIFAVLVASQLTRSTLRPR
ncbi:MAG: AAA family ATPase, partial [Betaproteobacteria bacterium AqS2]|nr:AAA family ATPase [Betaproteobacteria bacterium AqS2]